MVFSIFLKHKNIFGIPNLVYNLFCFLHPFIFLFFTSIAQTILLFLKIAISNLPFWRLAPPIFSSPINLTSPKTLNPIGSTISRSFINSSACILNSLSFLTIIPLILVLSIMKFFPFQSRPVWIMVKKETHSPYNEEGILSKNLVLFLCQRFFLLTLSFLKVVSSKKTFSFLRKRDFGLNVRSEVSTWRKGAAEVSTLQTIMRSSGFAQPINKTPSPITAREGSFALNSAVTSSVIL